LKKSLFQKNQHHLLKRKKPLPKPAEEKAKSPAVGAPPEKPSEPERKVEPVEEHGYDITKDLPKEIKGEGLFKKGIPPEVKKEIDKRVKELITGKPAEEPKKEETEEIPHQEKQSVPEEAGEEEVEFEEEKK